MTNTSIDMLVEELHNQMDDSARVMQVALFEIKKMPYFKRLQEIGFMIEAWLDTNGYIRYTDKKD